METIQNGAKLCGLVVLLAVIVFFTRGCGGPIRPEMGYVSGKITMDGVPVENVIVVMKPDNGRMAMSKTDDRGFYDIEYTQGEKGTKVGPTTVSFEWPLGHSAPMAIPSRYSAGKTDVKFVVKQGKQTFDFDMKSDANTPAPAPATARTTD